MNRIKERLQAVFGAVARRLQDNKKLPKSLRQPLPWCLAFAVVLCAIAVTATVLGHTRGNAEAYTGIAEGSSCVMEDDVAALYDDTPDVTPVESAQTPQIAKVTDNVHSAAQTESRSTAVPAASAAAQASAAPSESAALSASAAPAASSAPSASTATPDDGSTTGDADEEEVWDDVTQHLSNGHEQADGSPRVVTTTPTATPAAAATTDPQQPSTDVNAPPQISYTAYDEAVSQRVILFSASASDVSGTALTESNIVVSCNNTVCTPVYAKQNVMTYALQLASGSNSVTVTATSDAGAVSAVSQTIVYNPPAQDTVIVSVEATTVGLGYLIAPTQMTLTEGEPVSYYVDKLLNDSGFTTVFTGSVESDYYLASVKKIGAFSSLQVPTNLKAKINSEPDAAYVASFNEANHSADSLTELTITNQSGWMYSVNDLYYTVGMSLLTPAADDFIRVRYTLAFGRDIGGGIEGTNWDKEW